jgi:HD-like signal output (HDOD) protein
MVDPWRNLLFDEPRSFCAQAGITPDALRKLRQQLMVSFDNAVNTFPSWAIDRSFAEVFTRLDALIADAETAGVWAGMDYLQELRAQAELGNWSMFKKSGEILEYASRLIFCYLNPTYVPEILKPPEEREQARDAEERARWMQVDVDISGPVMQTAAIQKEVHALTGCPVVDHAAAAFAMAADGRTTSLSRVMELAEQDPGICAQVLIAANALEHDELTTIDDSKSAIGMLGEIKLNQLARATLTIQDKYLNVPPLSWTSYWVFLSGVARVSQFIAEYLEFNYLKGPAYTAGLLHDLGKLVLLRTRPWAFSAIAAYAAEKQVSMHAAEKKYIGCTTRELGVQFAEAKKLPPIYQNVIRFVESPELATESSELVAIVSLARHVCLHNQVGQSGDRPDSLPLTQTHAWQVLQTKTFPSFDLRKFEASAHALCRELRLSLTGQEPKVTAQFKARTDGPRELAKTE